MIYGYTCRGYIPTDQGHCTMLINPIAILDPPVVYPYISMTVPLAYESTIIFNPFIQTQNKHAAPLGAAKAVWTDSIRDVV